MSDEKKKISVIVPVSLLDRLRQQSDCNITEATIKGLELLVNGATNNIESDQNIIQEYLQEIAVLKLENAGLKARSEELQAHIETLKKELEDLKSMHNNYFLQMQTLINQRALEPPTAEKKKPFWKFW
jgi:peptidoglycan hydrolase CwlO-like protein